MVRLSDIIRVTAAECAHDVELSSEISNAKVLSEASKHDIAFYNGSFRYKTDAMQTKAGFCLVTKDNASKISDATIPLIVHNVQDAITQVVILMHGNDEYKSSTKPNKIHESANIHRTAILDGDVTVEEGVTIMANTFIGSGCIIKKNAFIYDSCSIYFSEIGERVVISSGSRIGLAGFGFVPDLKTGKHAKMPQIAKVIVGNDVSIGSNVAIDRGFLSHTVIGEYTKIDNLVQVAHGVKIGRSCFIAAQTGISGSSVIEDFCSIGGQSGIAGHLIVGKHSNIGAQSGVISDIEPFSRVFGTPATPIKQYFKMHARLKQQLV